MGFVDDVKHNVEDVKDDAEKKMAETKGYMQGRKDQADSDSDDDNDDDDRDEDDDDDRDEDDR